jgi:hypothetical protein
LTGSLSFTGLDTTSIHKPTSLLISLVLPKYPPEMKENLIGLVLAVSIIGAFVLLCVFASIDECYRRRERSGRSNGYVIATPNPPEPPIQMSGQQTGDASNGFSETDANAPALTYNQDAGSLVLPPPVVMRDTGGFNSGRPYQQSLLSTGSTPPPMYTDGSDR